ncbi:MAG: efflux RND transporter periplasmic adaptor subunit [Kiritimatiellae bacterium]|nr:efflux RND transporter periplasmic adaptor subunit [Kiritimatiellia bacterium]
MDETTTEVKKATAARAVAGTIGAVLLTASAFILGWAAQMIYAQSQEDKQKEAATAAQMAMAMSRPVSVETERVAKRDMNPPQSFMGHVEPIEVVDLRAQIDGTIAEVAFKEGSIVQAGDVLFLIDARVYEARVKQAEAALAKATAASENADRYYARISKVDKRSVTEAEIDQAYANMLEARAAIKQCEADLANAQINLGYTQITAPISGRIGKSLLKKGDYVAPSMGALARIIQTDPVRVAFSVSDKIFLDGRRISQENDLGDRVRAQLRLADGSIYSQEGSPDFFDNEMDSSTASLLVRYSFPNPKQELLSNAYVTVLLSDRMAQPRLAIPADAVLANATGDYVFVNVNGVAERRIVKLGELQAGYVEILSGLEEGEEVVTVGVVNISEGSKLNVINPAVPVAAVTATNGSTPSLK